jgi:LacI family transcriptional regulator
VERFPRVLLLVESSRSSGRDFLRGVAEYEKLHGPWSFYWEPRGLETAIPRLRDWRPDGIITRDFRPGDRSLPEGVPAISLGHCLDQVPGVVSVVSSSEAIADLAAGHLLNCGLKQFGYCGYDDKPWSVRRQIQFRQRINRAGLPVFEYSSPPDLTIESWLNEIPHLVSWLRQLPKPLGIMACNDDRAQQISEACKIANVRVPDDIALIGVDNDELVCSFSDPPLSSVALGFRQAGYQAGEALSLLMEGQAPQSLTIPVHPTRTVTRQSSEILAIEDANVARALAFIREHARTPMRVDDVARAAAISRRILEKRFRRFLERSVLEEIRRVRTDLIALLLVESDLSITQISDEMGFTGIQHFSRYFREAKGDTPLSYRRKHAPRDLRLGALPLVSLGPPKTAAQGAKA